MPHKKNFLFYPLLILLLGAGLRIYNLGTHSLWLDEAEVVLAANSLKETIPALKANPLLPFRSFLYKTFIYYWKFFGTSEFILRLSSALFGIFSILGIYFLGNLLFNEKAGIFSALLLALSPFHIYYSQELRMYSVVTFLTIISVYFLLRALDNGKNIFWFGYILASVLNIYLHSIVFFTFIGNILFFIIYFKKYKYLFKKWFICNSMIVVFLIPWIIFIISGSKFLIKDNIFFINQFAWIPTPSLKSIFFTFKNFSIGYNIPILTAHIVTPIFLLLFLYGALKALNKKESLTLSLICLFLPIILIFSVSQYKTFYVDRYFIINSIFYFLIIGNGLSYMRPKYLMSVMLILAFPFTLALKNYYCNYLPEVDAYHIGEPPRIDKRLAALYIIRNFQKGDIVLHTCKSTLLSFEYYFNIRFKNLLKESKTTSFEESSQLLVNFLEEKDEIELYKYLLKNKLDKFIYQIVNVSLGNPRRVWLVFAGWSPRFTVEPNSSESKIINWMSSRFAEEEKKILPGIAIYLYKKPMQK